MSSSNILKTTKTSNIGGRFMLNQEKKVHEQRLAQIYNKTPKSPKMTPSYLISPRNSTKKDLHQTTEHQKNILHLFQFIVRPKTMQDRYKDPNDFYAYPTLFLREQLETKGKKKQKKVKNKRKQQKNKGTQNNEDSPNHKFEISVSMVKQHLPLLKEFTREEIEEYADSITRIIFNYNMNSRQKIYYLKKIVKESIPSSYPPDFIDIVEEIFEEIEESIGFVQEPT